MSEYGDVVYRLGDVDAWEIYKETVEEWKAEKGFLWSDLTFITLDPTSSDQFIAIRNDGTWAGSIDDVNEEALETFALNFFARAKKKSKPSTSQSSGQMPNGTDKSTEAKRQSCSQPHQQQPEARNLKPHGNSKFVPSPVAQMPLDRHCTARHLHRQNYCPCSHTCLTRLRPAISQHVRFSNLNQIAYTPANTT
jgi:hypothetical protein